MEPISVSVIVDADAAKAWEYWSKPEHIIHWNFAADDWECPHAENDLRVGGTFSSRMQDKNTGEGFDFSGVYTEVVPQQSITYSFGDRAARITFEPVDGGVKITEVFDPETENSVEMQRQGWQAILENYKKYVESSN